jgi:hypothetical protein
MKQPFIHEELEVKQKFLEVAREFIAAEDFEKELAAAMLYANLSEYLSYHLLESLKQVVFSGSKAFWNGSVYFDGRDSSEKLTIGQIARELRAYGFPSKELIIPLLDRIARNRNKIMHNMLRIPLSEMGQIDAAIQELVQDSEELVSLVDDIYRGLPPSNITQTITEAGATPVMEATKDDQGEIKVTEKKTSSEK